MNRIDQLLENYRSHIQMPLRPGLPSSQRVWFAVYPAAEERRLTNRIDEFEMLTKEAGHPWIRIDLKGSLARWLASVDEEERVEWFRNPGDIDLYSKTEWKNVLTEFFQKEVSSATAPERTVFALTEIATSKQSSRWRAWKPLGLTRRRERTPQDHDPLR